MTETRENKAAFPRSFLLKKVIFSFITFDLTHQPVNEDAKAIRLFIKHLSKMIFIVEYYSCQFNGIQYSLPNLLPFEYSCVPFFLLFLYKETLHWHMNSNTCICLETVSHNLWRILYNYYSVLARISMTGLLCGRLSLPSKYFSAARQFLIIIFKEYLISGNKFTSSIRETGFCVLVVLLEFRQYI